MSGIYAIEKINLTRLKLFFAIALLLLVVAVIYYPSLDYDFVWDDFNYLLGNPYIANWSWKNVQWMFSTLYMFNWHPLVWLSFALDYSWQGGLNPSGYRLTNIILHGFNTVGVFLITILLLNIINHGVRAAVFRLLDRPTFLAALITAFLFAIHPQHIESVVWISERKDVLCLFFILLSVMSYFFYARQSASKWRRYILSLLLFILAIMSKPLAVTLPVVLLLLDVYPLRRTLLLKSPHNQDLVFSWNHLFKEKIVFFIPTFLLIILTMLAQSDAMADIEKFDLIKRAINAIHSVFIYISKFLFPVALSPLYPFPDYIKSYQQSWPKIITLIAGFFFLTLLCIHFWHRNRPNFLIIWLFYLITLSPMIGIIQVGTQSAADRYAYLPTIPFYILAGTGLAYFYYRPRHPKKAFGAKFLTIFGLVLISSILIKLHQDYLPVWKRNFILWSYTVQLNPFNYIAQHNLAAEYFLFHQDYHKALEHLRFAIYSGAPWRREENLTAEIYLGLERFSDALQVYEGSLKIDLGIRKDCVHYKIGWIHAKQNSFDQALQALARVPSYSPEFAYAQELATHIALVDPDPLLKSPVFEKINWLATAFDQRELEQAKLDHLLAQKKYYPCFNAMEFNP